MGAREPAPFGKCDHGRQPPLSDRSLHRRRCRRTRGTPDAARAAPLTSTLGRDATQYGVRPDSPDDQTRALQRAIDEAARAQVPLALPPGVYRTGLLRLQNGTQLIGVRGATRLVFNGRRIDAVRAKAPSTSASPTSRSTAAAFRCRPGAAWCIASAERDIRIIDCEITGSGGNGIWFENVSGDVSGNIITKTATTAIVSFDAQGLLVSRNTIHRHQRQRHRDPAQRDRRRRHAGARQPHRGHQGRSRRLRTVRQRHQRVSRRQRHRARQPHPQLRLFRGARQFGVQHPDHRQQRQRRPRGRALFRIRASRAR